MQAFDFERRQPPQFPEHLGVFRGQRVEYQPHQRRIVRRDGDAVRRAPRADRLRHVGRRGELRGIGVDDPRRQGGALGHAHDLFIAILPALAAPHRAALFEQPHAGDVLQEPHRAVHAALIGEVHRIGLLRNDRLRHLDAHQRPRPRREVGEAPVPGRHGRHGRSRIVPRDGHHGHRPQPGLPGHGVAEHPDPLAGHHHPREKRGIDTRLAQQCTVDLPRAGIHELRRREDRILAYLLAGEQVRQRVGHEKHRRGIFQRRHPLPARGTELEERIEIHDLDTRAAVHFLPGYFPEELLGNPVGIGIAVSPRKPGQRTVGRHAGHVDAPRVDTDRIDRNPSLPGQRQAVQDFLIEGVDVPIIFAADRKQAVREAVQNFEGDAVAAERGENDTAARGTEIDTDEITVHHGKF